MRCSVNVIDLKTFPNTIMLLKVDHFKKFLSWSNVDELVINSTTGCNCNNYKNLIMTITNLIITQCFLILSTFSQIPFTYSYLSRKYGVFPSTFKGDMHDSLKHIIMLCYHAHLSV